MIYTFYYSDKLIRVWKWNVGSGFLEESYSPLKGHKYSVTSVRISPQVCVRANIFLIARILPRIRSHICFPIRKKKKKIVGNSYIFIFNSNGLLFHFVHTKNGQFFIFHS